MVKIAGVQFIGQADKEANIATAVRMVRQAAAQGAQMVCLPELFSTMYFCVETRREYFDWAEPIPGPTIERMGALARETGIVLIAPIFERAPEGRFFNAAAVIGPDGAVIGSYRKSSIPFMDASRSAEPSRLCASSQNRNAQWCLDIDRVHPARTHRRGAGDGAHRGAIDLRSGRDLCRGMGLGFPG